MLPEDKRAASQDRDWQAFLYVSGEMSPAEAESFETVLVDDQLAREAVAEAVTLLATMSAGASTTTAPDIASHNPSHRTRLVAAIMTVAALVLVCFSLFRFQQSDRGDSPASELVSLWTESDGPTDDSGESEGVIASNGDDDLAVPGWMLAAVETAAEKKKEKE